MRVKDKTTFQSGGLYNITAQVQENTVLNRGLIDLGGSVVPQMIMSNNKDEKIERGIIGGLYFVTAFVAPFVLLPFFNKSFLARNSLVKNFKNDERKIIEVSKKYLAKDAKYMVRGIRKTANKLEQEAIKKGKTTTVKQDFENILNRFDDKELLRKKLIKTHGNVLTSDFLATAWMWCATPWIGTEVTRLRTNRSGFSATYGMIDEEQSRKNAKKHEQEKNKKLLITGLIGTIPSIIVPKLVSNGLTSAKNNIIKKIPNSFNYSKGMFPSKFIFGMMWLLCDYPAAIVSARDKYERRDRAIRSGANILVFFGGDFVLNNLLGRASDKYLGTKIMDRHKFKEKTGFLKKLAMMPRDFADIDNMTKVTPSILKRTKTVGASMYWATLVANMGILGFGVPAFMNKFLKKSVQNDSVKSGS